MSGLAALLSATNSSTGLSSPNRSWLVEELWTHAVSNIVAPLCESNNTGVVDEQQRTNRGLRMAAAKKALDVALALLNLLSATTTDDGSGSMLDKWLFAGEVSETKSDDVPALLGLCAFGRTVVCDIVSTWQAARNLLDDGAKEAVAVASSCLDILAVIISRRRDSAPLIAFWLGLWRQSVLAFSEPAAACLTSFIRRSATCRIAAAVVSDGDMLSGDAEMLSDDVGLVQSMSNELLMQLLQTDAAHGSALGVVAHLLAAGAQVLQVSEAVQAQFVTVLSTAFGNVSSAEPVTNEAFLLDVLTSLAATRSEAPVRVLPALARAIIPALANLVNDRNTSASILDKALDALVAFATARYVDPAQSGLVMAAILMLLLSLLPDELGQMLGSREICVAEAILGLATRAPETFRAVLLKLSASQPTAKRRLELAIRSRSSAEPLSTSSSAGVDDSTSTSERKGGSEGIPPPPVSAGKIALKSNFSL
ncbi:hypothetical protein IWW38_002820 [Coemansia aciculifera]|uniref:Uncharacterized protein n=1 Tax=Coemansia aciculifera TaxID=417176 RepID=A0ACC1M492_9FUNG|nr:hypothetical protein IWW38_002820 [Coemansia aciculifera]